MKFFELLDTTSYTILTMDSPLLGFPLILTAGREYKLR